MRPGFRIAAFGIALLGVSASGLDIAREVRVGVYENPPKLASAPDRQPTGILGDLLREIAQREGWTLVPVACAWEACLDALERGEIDLMPDVADSTERRERFDFHRTPALHSWSQLYRARDRAIESMLDLRGQRVAVLGGSVQETYLQDLVRGFGLDTKLLPGDSFDAAFAAVKEGRADAVAANHHYGNRAAPAAGLVETPIMFLPSRLYFAAPRGRNAELLAAIDARLDGWVGDTGSVYFEVLRRWGAPEQESIVPRYVMVLLVAGLVALLLSFAGLALLRREVARRTFDLRASEERLSTILDSIDAMVFIKDRQGRYDYVNRKVGELFGRPPEAVIGLTDDDLFDAPTATRVREDDRRVLEDGERVAIEETSRTLDGGHEFTSYTIKLPLRGPDGNIRALCGIASDLTAQRKLHEELHSLVNFDPLTRLPNRHHLLERLGVALLACAEGACAGALVVLDIARFQELNDSRGHDAGDALLRQVAQRLLPLLHEDAILARIGADEFALLLTGLPGVASDARQSVARSCQALLDAMATPFEVDGERYDCGCHLGVTLFGGADATVHDVLRQANLALSEAKVEGREGSRFFRPELQSMASARATLEADLREGIDQRQFLLHFQPQVDAAGAPFGLEALVRWQHPRRGMVSPGSFIPLAEASGLILPLGNWILRDACRELAALPQADGPDLVMAINVSTRQLHHPQFEDEVMAAVRESGVSPQRVELELTESLLLEDMEGAIAKMRRLKDFGVRIALDDFGTGYSSLSYLKRLPIDQLKIDVAFVRDLLIDPNDLTIVRTIIGLGRNLDLSVLAEGVETEAQRDVLAELGCHKYQGYLFSPPVPIDALGPWLRMPTSNATWR